MDHYSIAVAHLERAKVTRSRISAQLGLPDPDHREVSRLANQERGQVKKAEVHALLAIVQRIDDRRLAL